MGHRSHITTALAMAEFAGAWGARHKERDVARCEGKAAGHAFRALEILYDERESWATLAKQAASNTSRALVHVAERDKRIAELGPPA